MHLHLHLYLHLHLHLLLVRLCAISKKLAKFESLPLVVEGREEILEVPANTIPPFNIPIFHRYTIPPFYISPSLHPRVTSHLDALGPVAALATNVV